MQQYSGTTNQQTYNFYQNFNQQATSPSPTFNQNPHPQQKISPANQTIFDPYRIQPQQLVSQSQSQQRIQTLKQKQQQQQVHGLQGTSIISTYPSTHAYRDTLTKSNPQTQKNTPIIIKETTTVPTEKPITLKFKSKNEFDTKY